MTTAVMQLRHYNDERAAQAEQENLRMRRHRESPLVRYLKSCGTIYRMRPLWGGGYANQVAKRVPKAVRAAFGSLTVPGHAEVLFNKQTRTAERVPYWEQIT